MINLEVQRFFNKHQIDLDSVNEKVDCHIYSEEEINPISYDCAFRNNGVEKKVSVADIVGYDTMWRGIKPNIFESIGDFFDAQGDGYHTRALGMLEYSPDEIVEKLEKSFRVEPIVLDDTGEGKYIVSTNGLHRYTVLRALYLSELEKCNGNIVEQEKLKEKYTIPVRVQELDCVKTYTKFLLKRYVPDIRRIEADYDYNYNRTGKSVIINSSGEKIIVDDNELISILQENMKQVSQKWDFRDLQRYFQYSSFRKFVEDNLKEIVVIPQIRESGGEEHD